jgi:RNase P subunit RPR2
MRIRCKHCGEYFCPGEDTQDLLEGGYIDSSTVNTCDECWDLISTSQYDLIETYSDAEPGL